MVSAGSVQNSLPTTPDGSPLLSGKRTGKHKRFSFTRLQACCLGVHGLQTHVVYRPQDV